MGVCGEEGFLLVLIRKIISLLLWAAEVDLKRDACAKI